MWAYPALETKIIISLDRFNRLEKGGVVLTTTATRIIYLTTFTPKGRWKLCGLNLSEGCWALPPWSRIQ